MYVVSAQQMRDIDRFTIQQIGIPGSVLMENAGAAVVREMEKRWAGERVVVLAGPGNNGGDGLVIVRHLKNRGSDVRVWLVGDEKKQSEDFRTQLKILQMSGYNAAYWEHGRQEDLQKDLSEAGVVVDAMLGTGFTGKLREPFASVVQQLQDYSGIVTAVDIATGVNGDTGEAEGAAVKAHLTVTFAYPKWGHFLYPGALHTGELIVADISIPPKAKEHVRLVDAVLTGEGLKDKLPARPRFSHKGTYGHALVIAGSKEMPGAPVLAALAGLRTGCGLLTLAVPEPILPVVGSKANEPVFWGWPSEDGRFSAKSAGTLKERAAAFDVVAIGPGITVWDKGDAWLADIIRTVESPLIMDADALNLLSGNLSILGYKRNEIVLTPHPGEMARLCGCSVAEIEQNRVKCAREFAQTHGVYLILKGAYTLIATPGGHVAINPRGSAALAKGGSGDVLTGMLAGMIAQTGHVNNAIQLAVYLHGIAGEICGNGSMHATLAGDVIEAIGPAIKQLSYTVASPGTNFPGN
jgi:ADP-dependent NAD(P)H-hydrate dehydratase / NAD(P)H-hydrate epimerase